MNLLIPFARWENRIVLPRDAVVDDYLALLVRLHSLPVEPFVAAGITRADDERDSEWSPYQENNRRRPEPKAQPGNRPAFLRQLVT